MLSQKGNELAVDEIEPLSMSTDRKRKEKKRAPKKGTQKEAPRPKRTPTDSGGLFSVLFR